MDIDLFGLVSIISGKRRKGLVEIKKAVEIRQEELNKLDCSAKLYWNNYWQKDYFAVRVQDDRTHAREIGRLKGIILKQFKKIVELEGKLLKKKKRRQSHERQERV